MRSQCATVAALLLCLGQVLSQAEQPDDFCVLEGDQRQTLWNTLIAESRLLDKRRAKRLAKALGSKESTRQH